MDREEAYLRQPRDVSANLGFDGGGLARMQVLDLVGQKTEVSFQGWKRNPAFAAGTFAFTPGKDVDVVGQ